jgi:4-amino-4-deoxy-L-arabinose transferase-like glycosyltransferase
VTDASGTVPVPGTIAPAAGVGILSPAAQRARGTLLAIDPLRAVLMLIAIGTLARLAVAGVTGLGTDESYTVANARLFALSYVDYPPLHVWLVGAWAWLWSSQSPLVLRLPFIALFAGSTWMMFRLSALLFGERAGFWAALALNLAPVFAFPHASWVLPDGPLAFFLLSGAYIAARLLFGQAVWPRRATGWLAVGALTGLAMLTKYHGAFLPAGLLVFLLTQRDHRAVLKSVWPWAGVGVALLIFAPVLLWNDAHGWAGLLFQSNRLTGGAGLKPFRVIQNIGEQAIYLSPWLFAPLAILWVRALTRGPRDERSWFLAMLASGPIVFFTAATLLAPGLPHWAMPGWLFVFPLLGLEMTRIERRAPRWALYGTVCAAAILAVLLVVFATDARDGWLARAMPDRYARQDPTLDFVSWADVKTALAQRRLMGGGTNAVAALNWFEAGKLNYVLGKDLPVFCLCADPQQFRFLHDPARYAGHDFIVASAQSDARKRSVALKPWFDRVEPLAPVVLRRAGRPVIALALFRGVGFRPGSLQIAYGGVSSQPGGSTP